MRLPHHRQYWDQCRPRATTLQHTTISNGKLRAHAAHKEAAWPTRPPPSSHGHLSGHHKDEMGVQCGHTVCVCAHACVHSWGVGLTLRGKLLRNGTTAAPHRWLGGWGSRLGARAVLQGRELLLELLNCCFLRCNLGPAHNGTFHAKGRWSCTPGRSTLCLPCPRVREAALPSAT